MMQSTARKLLTSAAARRAITSSRSIPKSAAAFSSTSSFAAEDQASSSNQWLIGAAMATAAGVSAFASTSNNNNNENKVSCLAGHQIIGVVGTDGDNYEGALLHRMDSKPNKQDLKLAQPEPRTLLEDLMEQPQSVARAIGFGGRISSDRVLLGGLDKNEHKIRDIQHMVLSGCGPSVNSCKFAECIMNYLGSFDSVTSIDAATEAEKAEPHLVKKSTGMIVLGSEETDDVAQVVNGAMNNGVTVMSVANAIGDMVAQDLGEGAVASATAFTTQVTVLAMVALWFREIKDRLAGSEPSEEESELKEALIKLPMALGMALGRSTRSQCKEIAKKLEDKDHCYVLGRGFADPVAREGALKIKEMCGLNTQTYTGGKIGDAPMIMIILDDEHAEEMRAAAQGIKSLGAELHIVTDKKELAQDLDANPIMIQTNGPVTALGAVLPLQFIAYELATLRGVNPDSQYETPEDSAV